MNLPDSGKPGVFVAEGLEYAGISARKVRAAKFEMSPADYALVQSHAARVGLSVNRLLQDWMESHLSILRATVGK